MSGPLHATAAVADRPAVETISQRQMRNDSAEILRRVEAGGGAFIIANRGVEVARLLPFRSRGGPERDALLASGVLVPRWLGRAALPVPVGSDTDLASALEDDRSR